MNVLKILMKKTYYLVDTQRLLTIAQIIFLWFLLKEMEPDVQTEVNPVNDHEQRYLEVLAKSISLQKMVSFVCLLQKVKSFDSCEKKWLDYRRKLVCSASKCKWFMIK